MEVFALSGDSGTGKSTSAHFFAYENSIPAIVDDGLLIFNGKKIAGTSAKYEKNYITAIKRATFFYKEHTKEVRDVIEHLPVHRILIIGTSEKMVKLIASKLHLGPINHYVNIEDIRSSGQIKMALFVRKTQGKHVIPIPELQVEQSLFKRLISKGIQLLSPQKEVIGEATVVQPNFQVGAISIYPEVLKKFISVACDSIPEVHSYSHISVTLSGLPYADLQVSLQITNDTDVLSVIEKTQSRIFHHFQEYLGIELYSIDVHLTKIHILDANIKSIQSSV